MSKYIDAKKLIANLRGQKHELELSIQSQGDFGQSCQIVAYENILSLITSLRQDQQEENKLPDKRTRVNYAICELQSFKPLRETIVLDGYVYDEGKCYRENLLNYIHAIPESRLTEIRSYLKENEWWPYDDDTDWIKHEQPKVDLVAELKHHFDTTPKEQLEKEWKELEPWCNIGPTVQEFLYGKQPEVDLKKEIEEHAIHMPHGEFASDKERQEDMEWAKEEFLHFYELGLNARKEE